MLAPAVQRGDLRFPALIADDFNRANSTNLGRTPVGFVPWKQWRGSWDIASNRLRGPTSAPAVAVVNARSPDIDVRADLTEGGAVIFRASAADTYLRLGYHYFTQRVPYTVELAETVEIVYCTDYRYICITVPVRCHSWQQYHDHDRACTNSVEQNCCTRSNLHCHYYDDFETLCGCHGDELAIPQSPRTYPCGENVSGGGTATHYVTVVERRLHLEQVSGGSVTSLQTWDLAGSPGTVRVVAQGTLIEIFRNGSVPVGTAFIDFNLGATHHGVGLRPGGQLGRTADNFSLQVIGAV